jgi:hypothetical protein
MGSLSGIQRYLLVVEANKLATQEIVQETAQSMKSSMLFSD